MRCLGESIAIDAALNRLYIATEVHTVLEVEGGFEASFEGELPADLEDVELTELDPNAPVPTGLENDAPCFVAPDLVVRPPWVDPVSGFGGVELVVPRGGAFGTGEGDSTQAALMAMRAMWPRSMPEHVLDVGTGTGILALYAHRLGARRVSACDVDPVAVRAARELLPTDVEIRECGPEGFESGVADFVISNLDAAQTTAARDAILRLWNRRGPLVIAGLKPEEIEPVLGPVDCGRLVCRFQRGDYVGSGFVGA